MSAFNIDDYNRVEANEIDDCDGCWLYASNDPCPDLALVLCSKKVKGSKIKSSIFKLKETPETKRESLMAEIAEIDRKKEIKERELRELSNKEQGDE